MGFIKRLTAKKGTPERPLKPPQEAPIPTTGPRPDPLGFDPVGHDWLDRLTNGDAAGYPEFLAALARSERDFYVNGIADGIPARPAWLDAWVEREPDRALPWYVRGVHEVVWAWDARSHYTAEYVGEQQWQLFFERLRLALADLATAVRIDPTDPGPSVAMIPIGNGLQMDQDERLKNWAAIAEIEPFHLAGGHGMIQTLAPKWSGSLDAMFGFARELSAAAPDGDPIHVLIADAHVEARIESKAPDYFKNPEVMAEVRRAAARSVLHPAYVAHRTTARDVNTFAWIEVEVDEKDRVRELLMRSGDWITWPWTMASNKTARFRSVRTWAGLG